MANRKLQKDIDIIFKRIQEGLQDFNYHYERYESLTNTEDDSDNQREKEKLANDLKKEIKKLQKFREQIKHWLSNDTVNTLGPVGTSYSTKLSENKSIIEDAMETYKSVEKQTKLKTFSNQSIMMTFLDSKHGDDDDEESDEMESSEDEEENEYEDLSTEAVDSIRFFKDAIFQFREQTEKASHEFDKLAGKKIRKNNLSTIESKKEKIQETIANNKFHQKKLRKLIKMLKNGMVVEFNLIFALKGDIEEYLNTNGEYEFTKETELYEDIFNQIAAGDEDYSEIHEDQSTEPTSVESNGYTTKQNGHDSSAHSTVKSAPLQSSSATTGQSTHQLPSPGHHHQHQQQQQQQQHPNKVASTQSHSSANTATATATASSSVSGGQGQSPAANTVPSSPDITSPAIVRTLKPATTPSKPLGSLKWSAAAAVGIPEPSEKPIVEEEVTDSVSNENNNVIVKEESIPFEPLEIESIDLERYRKIISNSSLSKTELNLFSDMNLVRVPPGIQDLAISFASKRNNDEFKILVESDQFNQYTSPIYKPYLPNTVQPNYYSQFTNFSFKHPIQLTKFQSHWNKIRAYYGFDSLVTEIKNLIAQNTQDNSAAVIAELTFVLFYGFYYGLTPAENLIAEGCLFELGWKPYKAQLDNAIQTSKSISRSGTPDGKANEAFEINQYAYWFRRLKLISNGDQQQQQFEFGDYQVFDLKFWEIFVKYGFKFDYASCQMEPSKTLF
ncbi:uncharacterized protein LODBEIA_P44890 [Lodderomyces beijingensis]|uniref:CCR4-Not complex component Not N-terminal domain-containing protein n=1 Tax=Lodderomyces beijingensis TaxID=1775926 RepID=A0ABP0ZSS4_9ASCO